MMAWAIFHEKFNHDRRPKQALCFEIKPSEFPQCLPQDLIDAAVAAGKAEPVETPRPEKRRALRSRKAGK